MLPTISLTIIRGLGLSLASLLLLVCLLLLHPYAYDYNSIRIIRSVVKMSCLFLRPRPWQFEI